MRLTEIGGEFGFIDRIRGPHAAAKGNGLVVPIGDDAAVFDVPQGRQTVVTTDMLVENIHFRRDWSDPYSIGWKSAAASLSDIAAMGAEPLYAFLSLAISGDDTVEGLDRLYDGFSDCLNRYGARLAGGDTSASPAGMVVNVTLVGAAETGRSFLRSGARIGDSLIVTGTLGDAACGILLLTALGAPQAERSHRTLVNAHRRPPPRLPAACAAAATESVHAAMDISDGLAGDLPKLLQASGVGGRIDLGLLPISDDLRKAASDLQQDPLALAATGGEDYELLIAAPQSGTEAVLEAIRGTGIAATVIGEIVRTGTRCTVPDGNVVDLADFARGWDHFST